MSLIFQIVDRTAIVRTEAHICLLDSLNEAVKMVCSMLSFQRAGALFTCLARAVYVHNVIDP